MRVSVILLTRNRVQKLRRAYRSLCSQTCLPDQIIIVDDFSDPPVTYDIISDLNKPGIETIVVRVPEEKRKVFPPQRGRNFGAARAGGDILMFLDDDDLFEPDKIRDQLKVFCPGKTGFVYTGKKVFSESRPEKVIGLIKPGVSGNIYPDILLQNIIGAPSAIAVTRKLFMEVRGFDELVPAWDDWDFYIRCSRETGIGHDGKCNIKYSIPARDLSRYKKTKYERRVRAYRYFIEKYREEIIDLSNNKKQQFHANCNFSIAKSARKAGLSRSLPHIARSFINRPCLKPLFLLLPLSLIRHFKGDLH